MALVKQITRFNPTTNGPLHLGHIYSILVNEAEAHASGGKFIIRFEDDQAEWVWRVPRAEMVEYMDETKADLAWLGIQVDEYLMQSEMQAEFERTLEYLPGSKLTVHDRLAFDQQPELTYTNVIPYPYAPYLTRQRVVLDYLSLVNLLIRGEDLVTEFSLYAYFCELYGIQRPRMVYIPRLLMLGGEDMLEIGISKTKGNCKIKNYREEGANPVELLGKLGQACLIDPSAGWMMKNIKREPRWMA